MAERGIKSPVAKTSFSLRVDDVPYLVVAETFLFNEETRFYVSINGSTHHVFAWDAELQRLRAIDDSAGILPDALEKAINEKLYPYLT